MAAKEYEVVWGGDPGEMGVWDGDELVVSNWTLRKRGLTAYQVCQWSQGAIARLVAEVKRGDEETSR